MKRIKQPMFRYGEADFDKGYLKWGLHDPALQAEEAQSILRLLPAGRPLRILDLACGVGSHAIHWARQGHEVTAVDLSETFIAEGRAAAAATKNLSVKFIVGDISRLACGGSFDVVTWIEKSFFDRDIVSSIRGYLAEGGIFIMDDRNPDHPRTRNRNSNFKTWREENGRFFLESHETDESGMRHNTWLEIDPAAGEVIERTEDMPRILLADEMEMLKTAGFRSVELRTASGEPFIAGAEPYWLWVVSRK